MNIAPLVPSLSALSTSSATSGTNKSDNETNNNDDNNDNNNNHENRAYSQGCLAAEVLSAYDLPYFEAPQCVTLTTSVGGATTGSPAVTLKTGPPLARHKNRNSFRFSAPNSGNASSSLTSTVVQGPAKNLSSSSSSSSPSPSIMEVVAPLRDLYKSTVTIRIVYANKDPLETTYDLKQLRISESKWLILNLAFGNALASQSDAMEDEIPPTIRVKLTLVGPYRPEIAAVVAMAKSWFALVDTAEHSVRKTWNGVPKPPFDLTKVMVLPAVPLVATLLVASPVIAAICMVTLPFLLPVVLLVISIAAALLLLGASLFFSTRSGREYLGTAMAPIMDSLLSSRAGQTLIYDTGPRPTPVSVLKQILPSTIWGKLVISLLIDLMGSSSYLLPVVGEGFDVAWAPIQTVFIMAMYDTVTPNLKYVSFVEEILPFTDIVPTATIGFLCEFLPQLLRTNPELQAVANGLVATHGPNSTRFVAKLE